MFHFSRHVEQLARATILCVVAGSRLFHHAAAADLLLFTYGLTLAFFSSREPKQCANQKEMESELTVE